MLDAKKNIFLSASIVDLNLSQYDQEYFKKKKKKRSTDNVFFWPKLILNRDFALAREIIIITNLHFMLYS